MAKVAVTRLFVGGIAAIVAGVVLQCTAAIAALAGGVVSFGGPNWVEADGGAFAWTMVALAAVGVLVAALGGMAGVVSWVAAHGRRGRRTPLCGLLACGVAPRAHL